MTNNISKLFHVPIPVEGYWLSSSEILMIEKKKNCKYMGPWFIRDDDNVIRKDLSPCDIFWSISDNTYFGAYIDDNKCYTVKCPNVFSDLLDGYEQNGVVYIPLFDEEKIYLKNYNLRKIKVVGGRHIVVGERDILDE